MQAEDMLDAIRRNAGAIAKDAVQNILILFEDREFYLGDNCIRVDRLKYFRSYFGNAAMDVNFSLKEKKIQYESLLANNPHVNSYFFKQWHEIDFAGYDVIICITHEEQALLQYLAGIFEETVSAGHLPFTVYSVSRLVLPPAAGSVYVFPEHQQLVEYIKAAQVNQPRELYLSAQERKEADEWLYRQGLEEEDELLVLLDSSAKREKLLNIDTYFDILKNLLQRPQSKVLIFDEQNAGKQAFYSAWMGKELMDKVIFSNGLSLRQDMALIGSSHTRLVFGPCTGLVHCASGIFNQYLNTGICTTENLPAIITYTGEYPANEPAAGYWWQNSPLVTVLLLKEINNGTALITLDELAEKDRQAYRQIPCSLYTAEPLIAFIEKHLALESLSI